MIKPISHFIFSIQKASIKKARNYWLPRFESGQVLYLAYAYAHFTKLVMEGNLDVIKQSDFKGLVVPLIQEQFGVRLRNDLVVNERCVVWG